MMKEALDRLLRRTGRMTLREAINRVGTELVFCATEETFLKNLPADGDGLIVVTDNKFALDYLRKVAVYQEKRVHSISEESMETVDRIVSNGRPSVVVGFGGGRVLDVAKMVSFKTNVPLVSIPSAPTHDGLLSRNCALIVNGKKDSHPTKYPVKIIIPEHLWKASGDLEKAGRLDVLSNVTSLQDASLAVAEAGFIANNRDMGLAAEAVAFLLEQDDEENLAEALFLSGLAMHDSSRYCSGAEHEIEKALMPHFGSRYLHGQLVGAATLLAALVYKKHASEMPELLFDPGTLYDELVALFREKGLLDYALLPLEEDPDGVADVLKDVSAVRPGRYTLWNKVDSRTLDWRSLIEEVTRALSSS